MNQNQKHLCRTFPTPIDATEFADIQKAAAPRLLYSREEAAYQLSISVRSIDYMIAGKKIETRRIGSRILISHDELLRLASSARVKSVISPPN